MPEEEQDVNEQKQSLVSRIGPIEIDWPRTIGYYGGILHDPVPFRREVSFTHA